MERRLKAKNDQGRRAGAPTPLAISIGDASAQVVVRRGERCAVSGEVLDLLMRGATTGCVIEVTASGEDEDLAIAAITSLVLEGFGEGRGN